LKHFQIRLHYLLETDVVSEYKRIQDEQTTLEHKREIYLDQIGRTSKLHDLAKTIQIFGFLRSYRNDVVHVSIFYIWNILEKIASILEIDVLDMKYIDSEEVHLALSGEVEHKGLIVKRKARYMGMMIGNRRYALSGDDAKQLENYVHLQTDETPDVQTIKGTIAYPGNAKGTCRILNTLKDISKIHKGDILVISMTDPNYMPAMEKASAFVTDQGGILCHAAIVSRELKKPCIIGTKNATKVLKDGDLIEVDAEKGTIILIDHVTD